MTVKKIEAIARFLWKGKVFYREQGILRNRVEDTALLAPLIEGRTSDIPRIEVDQEDTWLLFPAKVFCGPSPIDRRRESIHIDYAYTDEIEGYREIPDALAGRNGFKVLDEIRMVRPGFYLGRAYMGDTFLLNFTFEPEHIAARETDEFVRTGRISEDCLSGEQQPAATTVN